jgi:hypothetical protein
VAGGDGFFKTAFGHQGFDLVSEFPELLASPDIGPETLQENPESKDRAEGDRIHQVSAFLNNEPHGKSALLEEQVGKSRLVGRLTLRDAAPSCHPGDIIGFHKELQ